MLIHPNGTPLGGQTIRNLTREQVRMFWDFEQMLDKMGLQFWMRCRKCLQSGNPNNGVRGNNDVTATSYVVECDCTKHVYKGADAPNVH